MFLFPFLGNPFTVRSDDGCVNKQLTAVDQLLEDILKGEMFNPNAVQFYVALPEMCCALTYRIEARLFQFLLQDVILMFWKGNRKKLLSA